MTVITGTSSPMITTVPAGNSVPRLLHQIYFSDVDLPEHIQKNIAHLKKLNPGWDHQLYDLDRMEAFILANYGESMLGYFKRINPKYGAVRADFFRYLLMYQCGGVYLDIKSSLYVPLDAVIKKDDRYLISYWHNKPGETFPTWGMHDEVSITGSGEFQQWHIVAAPGHPFLKSVIERVLTNMDNYRSDVDGVGFHGVFRLAGGIPYTLSILPLLQKCRHRFVDSQFELGFIYSICGERNRSHAEIFGSADYRYQVESIIPGK
jgi:mannosyltransferase OCH1-like enzyme